MIERIDTIVPGLLNCNRKCRKCSWRNPLSGECTLNVAAAHYIKALEIDNGMQMVYCKNCVFCEVIKPDHAYEEVKYKCMHREGLANVDVSPFDHCSKGVDRENA